MKQHDSPGTLSGPMRIIQHFLSLGTNAIAVCLLLLLLVGTQRDGRFWQGLRVMLSPAPSEAKADVRAVVLQQIRGASELTTAVFGMESVVPAHRDRTIAGYTIGKTTLLYIAYGEVRAGVDLSAITADDVQVSGDSAQVQLPPAQILDSKIDVNRSQVYDYDRGFFSLGPDAAPELQSLAQRESLAKLVDAACQQQILVEANQKAELAVTQLLTTAGFESVQVTTQPVAATDCAAPVTAELSGL